MRPESSFPGFFRFAGIPNRGKVCYTVWVIKTGFDVRTRYQQYYEVKKTMANENTSRRRRKKSSPMPMILIGVLVLVIFLAAVGIGVSLLGGKESGGDEESSSSIAVIEPSSAGADSESEPEVPSADLQPSGDALPSDSSSSSSAAATSLDSIPSSFDPKLMEGDSGFFNIPSYKQINSDVKGWLCIPGTNINYPVLWANDVMYYIDKNIYKQTSKDGVVYAGPTVRFGNSDDISRNTVLFGHNWTNYSANPRIGNASDVMFAQLAAYHYREFANAYPYIWYSTDAEEMKWVIFAAFYTDIGFNYIEPNPGDEQFMQIVNGAKSRSRHNFDVDVKSTDKILTLSTCTRAYGSSDKQRFVVMARLLREGEQVKAVTVTNNPNPVLPSL